MSQVSVAMSAALLFARKEVGDPVSDGIFGPAAGATECAFEDLLLTVLARCRFRRFQFEIAFADGTAEDLKC
jgi:hypothetical protein